MRMADVSAPSDLRRCRHEASGSRSPRRSRRASHRGTVHETSPSDAVAASLSWARSTALCLVVDVKSRHDLLLVSARRRSVGQSR